MMADNQMSIGPANKRSIRSSSIPALRLQKATAKTRLARRSIDVSMAAGQSEEERLADGRVLVLKVIGKINLRIERKDYEDLLSIFHQVPSDVLVLILGKISVDNLYQDMPSSLAALAALFSKLQSDCKERFPKNTLCGEDFIHHLVKYFYELLKYNSRTFSSARSREHIRHILNICLENDKKLAEKLTQKMKLLIKVIDDFSQHTLVELVSRSATKYCMKLHEALKIEMERATAHYKMALQEMNEVLQNVPDHNLDFTPASDDSKEKTVQQMRLLTQKLIEDRLHFNQAVLGAVDKGAKGQVTVATLVGKLESRVKHDKEVLSIATQVQNEFNIARQSDEPILSTLERFRDAYTQVYQLCPESINGTDKYDEKMPATRPQAKQSTVSTTRPRAKQSTVSTKEAAASMNFLEEPGGSDTDVFDSVTQLDDDTDLDRLSSTLSSTDSEKPSRENKNKSRITSKLQEMEKIRQELAEKDKQLQQAQERMKEMEGKEKEMRNRLADQAQRQLRRGSKFDDLAEVDTRPSTLTEHYDNLFSQTRIEALDDLDEIEAFEKLDDASSIKAKLLFSVIVVSYRTVYRSLAERQHRIKRLLDIQGTSRHAQSVLDDINVYFKYTASHFNIATIKKEVSTQLWKTLYDFPELQKCDKLRVFIDECVTLAWKMSVQTPPMVIHYETDKFNENMHTRFLTSNADSMKIQYHLWPALIDSHTRHVFYRGVVVT